MQLGEVVVRDGLEQRVLRCRVEFVLLWGLYLLFAASRENAELFLGVAVAVIGTMGFEVVFAQLRARFLAKPYWLSPAGCCLGTY